MKFEVVEREYNGVIDVCETREQAEGFIEHIEKLCKEDGTYEPNLFYINVIK